MSLRKGALQEYNRLNALNLKKYTESRQVIMIYFSIRQIFNEYKSNGTTPMKVDAFSKGGTGTGGTDTGKRLQKKRQRQN